MKHYSVLKNEVLVNLNIKEDGTYVDATVGYAGVSSLILKRLKRGFLFAFDQDEEAVKYSNEVLSKISGRFKIFESNFVFLKEKLEEEKIHEVDGIVFDLGLSSPQIDEEVRGFSFMHDAPLDMRMNRSDVLNAKTVVNSYSLEQLTHIFFVYGEEARSKDIAKKIIEEREKKEILTTLELVSIIESAVGAKYFYKQHPERKIFQAIRIEVNQELSVLENVLPQAISMLKCGGRLCVITFHSLEDRIVKQIFKKYSEVNPIVKGLPEIPPMYKPMIKLVTRKPILPSEKELSENSRSKSAKLRIVERI